MPVIHSSPHPTRDRTLNSNVDWNPNPEDDDMAGNPYPNVGGGGFRPGYDADQWAGDAGDEYEYAQGGPPMQRSPWTHASQFNSGSKSNSRRHHDPRGPHPHERHTQHRHAERDPRPWAGRQRAASFDGHIPVHQGPHPHHMRGQGFRPPPDEEDSEWFDEEEFEYDPYDEEEAYGEPPFLPPHMGPARQHAWDSSDEEGFGFEEDGYPESETDSYEAENRANRLADRRADGPPLPRRGPHPHARGHMRRGSSPPPLETPPDSPPPLGGPGMMRGGNPRMMRGGDPRMMRGDPRMMQGQMRGGGMPARGGGGMMHTRGGPPRGQMQRGQMQRGHGYKRARFAGGSASSFSSGDGWGGITVAGAAVRRSSSTGGLKKAIQWLTKPGATLTTIHPLLRGASLLRGPTLTWDVARPPVPVRAGVPVGVGVGGFAEPATSPPVSHMRLLISIPGLGGAQWRVDVWPSGPPSPYTFTGSPSAFARALPFSPFPSSHPVSPYGLGPPAPVVRCADVLHAVYALLQRRATENDFWALDERRREKVSRAFWVRCRAVGGGEGEAMEREVQTGVKRIDFMEGRTRWEGLDVSDMDEWTVRLGRT